MVAIKVGVGKFVGELETETGRAGRRRDSRRIEPNTELTNEVARGLGVAFDLVQKVGRAGLCDCSQV